MSEFTINVVQDPSTIIDINNSNQTVSLNILEDQYNSIQVNDNSNDVLLNPSVFYNGINIVYLSGVSGELLHNTFGDLQGGSTGQYYHLSSGQYFNLITGAVVRPNETGSFLTIGSADLRYVGLAGDQTISGAKAFVLRPSVNGTGVMLSGEAVSVNTGELTGAFYPLNSNPSNYVTGSVVRPSETGVFYPTSNPSGYITGVDLSAYVTGNVVRPSETGNFITASQTGAFYAASNPSGFITGVNLSNYSTIAFSTGISGSLQNQITNLNNQTGNYYPTSNPSGFITGVDLSAYITGINNIVYTTGNQDVSGLKDFQTRPTVLDIPVLVSGDAVDLIHLYGKNDQGSTIYKGQPVYINGANGANPLIKLASNTGERTSSKTIGLLSQNLSVNAFGYIITEGVLEGFDTSAGTAGDPMWLGPTGNIIYGTGNKPYGNNHLVSLGFVLRSNNNNGKVYVKVQNGFEIEELHKVYAINPSNKDTLLYNSGSGAWFARQLNTGDISGISDFVAKSETGAFYPISNPSGYVTGSVVRPSETGNFITASQTGAFYAASNPSGFITGVDLSTYATITNLAATGSTLQTNINNLSGVYSTISNLNSTGSSLDSKINLLSGSSVLLYGNQTISGIKNFQSVPLVSGEEVYYKKNVVYFTGNNFTPDANLARTFEYVLTGLAGASATLNAPINMNNGENIVIKIKQSPSGSNNIIFNSNYKFPGGVIPSLTLTPSKADIYTALKIDSNFYSTYIKDFIN